MTDTDPNVDAPAEPNPKFVLFCEAVENVQEKAPPHMAAHSARLREFHDRGDLLTVGTWLDGEPGAMAVFRSRESIDEFMQDDRSC